MPSEKTAIALVPFKTPKGWVDPGAEFDAGYLSPSAFKGHVVKGHILDARSAMKAVKDAATEDKPKKRGK